MTESKKKPKKRAVPRRRVGEKVKPKVKPKRAPTTKNTRGKALTKPSTAPPGVPEVISAAVGDPYDENLRYIARLLFISGAASVPKIAKELGVKLNTVRYWRNADNWKKLQREVQRFAAKESVRQVRRAMGRHVAKIDRNINVIFDEMQTLIQGSSLKPIASQSTAYKIMLEALRLKIALFRAVSYGASGRAMAPHPSTMLFDGTQEEVHGMLANTKIEELMDTIPEYMKKAAEFVHGIKLEDDVPPEVLDAISLVLEKADPSKEEEKEAEEAAEEAKGFMAEDDDTVIFEDDEEEEDQ